MKIHAEIDVYESEGTDSLVDDTLSIESHWNRDEMIVLAFRGKEITVNAHDLKEAIDRTSNWKR